MKSISTQRFLVAQLLGRCFCSCCFEQGSLFSSDCLLLVLFPTAFPAKAWADAFRSSPDLTGVVSVYEDLRRKGLDFPVVQLDGNSTSNPTACKVTGETV